MASSPSSGWRVALPLNLPVPGDHDQWVTSRDRLAAGLLEASGQDPDVAAEGEDGREGKDGGGGRDAGEDIKKRSAEFASSISVA